MSTEEQDRLRQIAELEAALKLPLPETARQQIQQSLQALVSFGSGNQIGTVSIDNVVGGDMHATDGSVTVSGTQRGAAVGVNRGTMKLFFGGREQEDGATLLSDYLDALDADCQQLKLSRLQGGRRQTGAEQQATPALRLQAVYTSLTTDGPPITVHERERSVAYLKRLVERLARADCSPAQVPPEQVRVRQVLLRSAGESLKVHVRSTLTDRSDPSDLRDVSAEVLDRLPDAAAAMLRLVRPELALEAIRHERRLVLLGEPGSGKSTALRYLALLLARRARDSTIAIPGWQDEPPPVPVLCPLGLVASAMERHGADATLALWRVLGDQLEGRQGLRSGLRDHLKPALRRGGLLLLFDGLDEVSAAAGLRQQIAAAISSLASESQARMVVTCRTLPYDLPGDWKLPAEAGWQRRTIQPLAFGQVCTFVQGWYAALATTDPTLPTDEASTRADQLIGELAALPQLQPLVRSPLLLTMLAILHANTAEVPRDRARLYDECVQLLLERWEPVRQLGMQRPGLLERLGNIPGLDLDLLRGVIQKLALQTHDQPPEADGRGAISDDAFALAFFGFFRKLGCADPLAKVAIVAQALQEDAGLLQARADNHFAFPHLTFQEYLAACALADHPELPGEVDRRWHSPDADRWREVLLLLAGQLRRQGRKAVERDGLGWLRHLLRERVGRAPKEPTRRRRDVALASKVYVELGGSAAFANSQIDLEAEVEGPLRAALVALLGEADPALTLADRMQAARLLAELGDPRFPVQLDAWRMEIAQRSQIFGRPAGCWCHVPAGSYRIGGWEPKQQAASINLPAFWIARFPLTVAQYAPFVAQGYGPQAKEWWTPNGWQWKEKNGRTQPWGWDDPDYNGANQPVIGVTWYEATAYCAWLSAQLANDLPPGYVLRLPSEAEWEVAAAYAGAEQLRPYPWGGPEPNPELAIYAAAQLNQPAPVGCCPAGAAACGALDLAGNVWELMASSYKAYPAQSNLAKKDFTTNEYDVLRRGGSYYNDSANVRCGARDRNRPDDGFNFNYDGFRVIVAPRLAHTS